MRDHWGRLAIDATMPFGRQNEFVRKRIAAAGQVDLRRYLG
jgi:4-hydroxybenzoate decarboxylase